MTYIGRVALSRPRLFDGVSPEERGEVAIRAPRAFKPGVEMEISIHLPTEDDDQHVLFNLTPSEAVKLHALLGDYLERPCAFKADDLPKAADAFRVAWNKADRQGDQEGKRVVAGLKAALITLGFDEEV